MGLLACPCGEPPVGYCGWPVEKWLIVCVRDLLHGDICMSMDQSRTGKILNIEALLNVKNPNLLEFTVERLYSTPRTKERVDVYRWDIRASIKVKRSSVCARPACFRHVRDLDGRYICSDHWSAQLALIA
jgi:hypothetical protein